MRILNEDSNLSVKSLQILLTKTEAFELIDSLQELLDNGQDSLHTHINDKEYQHELTVAIYYDDAVEKNTFNQRIMQLIKYDV